MNRYLPYDFYALLYLIFSYGLLVLASVLIFLLASAAAHALAAPGTAQKERFDNHW